MGAIPKVLSKWAEVRKVTVKTSLVTGKPAVKSAKVSRQGTKRNGGGDVYCSKVL